eukprot:gene3040-biopygen2887
MISGRVVARRIALQLQRVLLLLLMLPRLRQFFPAAACFELLTAHRGRVAFCITAEALAIAQDTGVRVRYVGSRIA